MNKYRIHLYGPNLRPDERRSIVIESDQDSFSEIESLALEQAKEEETSVRKGEKIAEVRRI